MVAKTPPKLRRLVPAPPHHHLLHETIRKVDKCMARLQELQFTASGGAKSIDVVNLCPLSSRGYLRSSLRCKQDSFRLKKTTEQISPPGKFQKIAEEWRRMSLPAMLVNETMAEILHTSQFAREIALAIKKADKSSPNEPITPTSNRRSTPQSKGSQSQLRSKRRMEKQPMRPIDLRSSPKLQRARSRIRFKATSPIKRSPEKKKVVPNVAANRVSPRNKPWTRKTVLFPNPLFLSSPSSNQPKFCRTRSPIIGRSKHQQQPHRFIIKSPAVPSKKRTALRSVSPPAVSVKRSPKNIARLRRSLSPARLVSTLASPLKNRFSALKGRAVLQNGGLKMRSPPKILKGVVIYKI